MYYRETQYHNHSRKIQPRSIVTAIIASVAALLVILLVARLVLSLMPVSQLPSYTSFIYSATYPFVAPFLNLFPNQWQVGSVWVEFQTVLAMAFWAAIAWLQVYLISSADDSNK